MRLYRFDAEVGDPIGLYGSRGLVMSRVAVNSRPTRIGVMYLEPGGVIGHHAAATPQLFLVVQGAGHVRGGERVRVPIAAGQAAFWDRGEWHETTTDTGLVAVVIESDEIDPDRYLDRLEG